VGQAATVVDPDSGETFIQLPTQEQVQDVLEDASAVGDDRIQSAAGQEVNREAWTHGSAEQRMRWFTTEYEQGSMAACDTFAASAL